MVIRPHLQQLVERIRMRSPLRAAFVYPCDRDSLQLALSGSFAGYLAPVLVGPETRLRELANMAGLDISRLELVDTADDPRTAGIRAAELARDGRVAALVRGSLSNEDLLAPVAAPESGLRTDRRLSHATFLDLPGRAAGLLLADAHLNITPNLAAKRDILLNTIDLAFALGFAAPAVALLAATDVESPAFPSTRDAIALKLMAARGQFRGAIVDGPMTPDSALSGAAARANGATSEIAGRADVLIAPSMEAATMVLRTLTALTGGLAAGLVLGARVPVVAPARTDPMEVRMASCVLASVVVSAAAAQAEQDARRTASPALTEAAAHVAA